jgi:osmotically-inducible protein OsmY
MDQGSKRGRSRLVLRRLRAALVVAITLAVTGCATPDNRTPQERAADQAIARRIEAALIADPYLDADHVTVEVTGGVARVSGVVGDDMDLKSVLRICWAVPGVRDVDDQVEIFDFGEPGGAEGPTQ